ncbi:GNAT family N-acetyltransferase [Sphingomonas sp. HF-S4]|uniref:GNAT family N-acetyltransferase n=1 Tax=Sphingomonas agrestis TaxID=3080540 RepID=A0ABU3YC96_9SPHN|nr:GNAT family N-acetyltransferase [Sphingomonas sp. HF-S4]MDV3458996.1 GNAT family N-acetyltransferase [Sphingomonas sp. HF-S4]
MIDYRHATPADLPAIDALFRESFVATFGHLYSAENLAAFLGKFTPEAWTHEYAKPGNLFRLAEDGDGLVGYCAIGQVTLPIEPGPPAIELHQLYLAERGKGSGAAQSLMTWALETARTQDFARIVLSVFVDNHRAKRFYERYGFVDRGPYTFMVGDHADEDRLMSLTL